MAGRSEGLYAGTCAANVDPKVPDPHASRRGREGGQQLARAQSELLGDDRGVRFHIDARKTREWGTAGRAGGWGCEAVVREGALPYVPPVPTIAATGASPEH